MWCVAWPWVGNDSQPSTSPVGDADVLLGHRRELAPERVEEPAVEASCRALEPGRVDEMRRPDRRDPDGELRVLADDRPGRAGVVEMDVGEEQVPDVRQLEPLLRQPRLE